MQYDQAQKKQTIKKPWKGQNQQNGVGKTLMAIRYQHRAADQDGTECRQAFPPHSEMLKEETDSSFNSTAKKYNAIAAIAGIDANENPEKYHGYKVALTEALFAATDRPSSRGRLFGENLRFFGVA